MRTRFVLLTLALSLFSPLSRADEAPPPAPATAPAAAPAAPGAPLDGAGGPQPASEQVPYEHVRGPATGKLGSNATVTVPAGHLLIEKPAALKKFFDDTHNLYDPSVTGVLFPPLDGSGSWWVVFTFSADGYVKDDDKDELDADKILEALQKGTEEGNAARRAKGWDEIKIVGWHTPPKYDERTHNLEWATIVESTKGKSVNYEVRLLGRRGVMSVTLIDDPSTIGTSLPALRATLDAFKYVEGEDYGSYREGDKVAEYTLGALIAGGALALAAKSGLLGKFWKVIVAGVVALGAGLKKLFSRKKE